MASISLTSGASLVAVTAAGEDGEAFGGELLGDLAADEVAGADDRDRFVSLLQGSSPHLLRVKRSRPLHLRSDSANLCFRSLPVDVAGSASIRMTSDGRL